jgi:glycosyltransferase involved in cell wall biosynthesis
MRRAESFFKDWWIKFFTSLSRMAYEAAEHVTTLFEGNRRVQISEGARPETTQIIVNGIEVAKYAQITPRQRQAGDPFHVGFVGRVTQIKDVKTLLHALALVKDRGIPVKGFILGPLDEEPEYARECTALAGALGLDGVAEFPGRVDASKYYPQLDVLVLTSLSEGMPMVILEASCAGLPVVASDVGACRDMLQGQTPPDRALGESGFIAPVASPRATAAALERLARSPELARRLGMTGRRRVMAFYEQRRVMDEYRELYEAHLHEAASVE